MKGILYYIHETKRKLSNEKKNYHSKESGDHTVGIKCQWGKREEWREREKEKKLLEILTSEINFGGVINAMPFRWEWEREREKVHFLNDVMRTLRQFSTVDWKEFPICEISSRFFFSFNEGKKRREKISFHLPIA